MGFFANIKKNLNHGGVKLELTAPDTVRLQDAKADLQVTVLNTSDQPNTVNSLSVNLFYDESNKDMTDSTGEMRRNVTSLKIPGPFVLQPAESKVVPVALPISGTAEAAQSGSAGAEIMANAMNAATVINQLTSNKVRSYHFSVDADIEGIKLGPSKTVQVQVLGPLEIGTKHFKIGL